MKTRLFRVVTSALLFTSLSAAFLEAQSSLPLKESPPLPDYILYRHFFLHLLHLDATGSGGPSSLRAYYQAAIGLSSAENAGMKAVAVSCGTAVTTQDRIAAEVIARIRAQYPKGMIGSGHQIPAFPAELQLMQAQRNGIILEHVQRLKDLLGAQRFSVVQNYVHNQFARNLYLKPVPPPDPKSMVNDQPFETEGAQ